MIIKNFYWLVIPVIVLILLNEMVFQGKVPLASDTVSIKPISNWVDNYNISNDDLPQWYPYAFGGMPSYGSYTYTPGDPTLVIRQFLFFNRGITYWFFFMLGGLGVYLLSRRKKLGKLAAVFGGLIYGISPYLFGLINAGHSTKIMALGYAPWVLIAADYCILEKKWRGILFLAIATALQLWSNHPQIVYYTWMIIVFWWLWYIVGNQVSKVISAKDDIKVTFMMIAGIGLAVILVSDPYFSVYEFQQHSNRGGASVLDDTGQTETGTSWDYATQWSFQPKELISFLYPYHYGLQNYSTRDIKSAAYWGGMPFTQSTHYFGILTILVAILGALLKKPDRFQTFLWVSTGLILFVGFGKYIPVLYGPLYKLAPFFSKFRVPSMIYALLPLPMGLLAAYGMEAIMNNLKDTDLKKNAELRKKALIVLGSGIVLSLVLILFGSSIITFIKPGEANKYEPRLFSQIVELRKELFQQGLLLSLVTTGGALAAIWIGIKGSLKPTHVSIIIIALAVGDLWYVDKDFLYLKNSQAIERQFKPNDVTKFLTSKDELFRIYPVDEFNSNWYGYYGISSIGGYRPVKLRTYQDLLDAGGLNSIPVINMLNVKYLISSKQISHPDFKLMLSGSRNIYLNTRSLPRVWLVNRVKLAADQKESLKLVLQNDFDPSREAVILGYNGDTPDSIASGEALIERYSENEITISLNAKKQNYLVLSENYYSPGWKAEIDEQETTIYQTNHILRGIAVPEGNHTVRFWYDNSKWKFFRYISRTSLVLMLILLGFGNGRKISSFLRKTK
ncbi:MAG: YfhO family protein [Planctomycetia bacterium]|nr:YfhO family protein [Planctomycetia bacterium]